MLILRKGKLPCTSVVLTICSLEAGKTVEIGTLLLKQVKTGRVGQFLPE